MAFLDWLNDIIQALLQFFPRLAIVRATHGGIKWKWGYKVVEMKPGWRWYWPFTTEIEIVVVARQTLDLPPQALMTKDMKQVAVGGVVVYRISDVVQAIGERNWDVEGTLSAIAQAAIVEVVTKWTLSDLLEHVSGEVEEELTEACRKQLRQFGVFVARTALNSCSQTTSINILGIPQQMIPVE